METAIDRQGEQGNLGAPRSIILWLLFFFFSLALGYPTLSRYDPRELGGDQAVYYQMTIGDSPPGTPFSYRLLVPTVAKPFYWLAHGRIGTWNPVWFGMLISNSIFCATFSFLLLLMGYRILGDLPLALLGCALVLLNYGASDLWLSGYVDTAEACLLMATAWLLFTDRWWPLPLVALLGGLAKQSFLPFASIFAFVWWFTTERSKRTNTQLLWVAALAGAAFASVVFAYWWVSGELKMPWTIATQFWGGRSSPGNATRALGDHRFWYPFVWLLPLGVWRLDRFPRPWIWATAATALFAFLLACYSDLGNGDSRAVFNIVAPLLSLSAACFIATGGPWTRKSLVRR